MEFLAHIAIIDGKEVVFDHYTFAPSCCSTTEMDYLGQGEIKNCGGQPFYFWKYKREREGKC